jgi:hypothetical protein
VLLITITTAPGWFYLGVLFAKIIDGSGRTKILAAVAALDTANRLYHHHHPALILKNAVFALFKAGPAYSTQFIIDDRVPVL